MGTNSTGCSEWERDYDHVTERPPRYFVSEYTDGPATRWNVIDRKTQEAWRFGTKEAAEAYASKLEKMG